MKEFVKPKGIAQCEYGCPHLDARNGTFFMTQRETPFQRHRRSASRKNISPLYPVPLATQCATGRRHMPRTRFFKWASRFVNENFLTNPHRPPDSRKMTAVFGTYLYEQDPLQFPPIRFGNVGTLHPFFPAKLWL